MPLSPSRLSALGVILYESTGDALSEPFLFDIWAENDPRLASGLQSRPSTW